MKRPVIIAFVFCLFLYNVSTAQVVGKQFPELSAETVDDKVVTIPKDVADKYTLVGLAYSKKAEKDLGTWMVPVYNTFVYKPEKPSMFASFAYDINVYIIPMFTGVNAAAQGTVKKKAAAELDPKLQNNILFYKGELKTFKKELEFDKKDVPYFFVIDKNGKIVYATSGIYSEAKMDEIESIVSQ